MSQRAPTLGTPTGYVAESAMIGVSVGVPCRPFRCTKENPNDPYPMMDASVSLRRGALGLSVFLDNAFDVREIVWETPNSPGWPGAARDWRDRFVGYYAVIRPRTLSLSVGVDLQQPVPDPVFSRGRVHTGYQFRAAGLSYSSGITSVANQVL